MRKNWPFLVAVAVLGAAAGTAIAGLPGGGGDDFVISSGTSASGAPQVTPATAVSSTLVSIATSTPRPTTTLSVASQAPVPTTVAPASTTTTSVPATTTTAPAPVTTTTATTTDATLGRDQVRLVLANGDGRFNLVGRNADRLLALGYVSIDQTDVGDRPPATTIYFRPGFADEAEVLALDLQTPNAIITALPATPVTGNDGAGDLIVVLGPDAIR